jgi:hypothetical protein
MLSTFDTSTNTLLKWLKYPDFAKEYRTARREVVNQSVARLQQATGAAGTVMLKLMADRSVPAAVRPRTAECVFDRLRLSACGGGPTPALYLEKKFLGRIPSDARIRNGHTVL